MPKNRQLIIASILILLFVILKFWLVQGKFFIANTNGLLDDGLYFKEATSIVQRKWLGEYDNRTLIKGPGYPLYIAILSLFKIPQNLGDDLLYLFACMVFFIAITKISKKYIFNSLIFGILLLDPVVYYGLFADSFNRQYLNLPISIFILSLSLLTLAYTKHKKRFLFLSLLTGFFSGYFRLIRGEHIWIAPLLIIFLMHLVYLTYLNKKKYKLIGNPFLLGILIFLIGIAIPPNTIKIVNFFSYGEPVVDELSSKPFVNAYSALMRVKPVSWLPHIPVTKKTRLLIYSLGPTFSKLRPFLEGGIGNAWTQNSAREMFCCTEPKLYTLEKNEMAGGWFIFAFRDAVTSAGYKDLSSSFNYYRKLANEIDILCNLKKLDCYEPFIPSLMSPLLPGHYPYVWQAINRGVHLSLTSPPIHNERILNSDGNEKSINLASKFIHQNNVVSSNKDAALNDYPQILKKIKIINFLSRRYSTVIPILLVAGLIIFIIHFRTTIYTHKVSAIFFIQTGALFSSMALISIVALVEATSFPAVFMTYLAPAHSFLIIFTLLSFI